MGELNERGIKPPSRNTVKNILKENGLEPGPKRGEGTWDEFLKTHAATLWQCDFFSRKVLTIKGFRDLFLLVFIHVETRRVYISPATHHPNEARVKEQGQAFLKHVAETGLGTEIVMHDRDTKFPASFDTMLEDSGLEVMKTQYRSPNTNAFVERFIQMLQQECLDYFIIFGQEHIDHLVSEFVTYYHEERPHQSKGNDVLIAASPSDNAKKDEPPADVIPISEIECRERLGGVLKHYYRKAA